MPSESLLLMLAIGLLAFEWSYAIAYCITELIRQEKPMEERLDTQPT